MPRHFPRPFHHVAFPLPLSVHAHPRTIPRTVTARKSESIFLALNFHILVSALLNFSIHKLSFLHSLLLR
jgi:hypothetical protein